MGMFIIPADLIPFAPDIDPVKAEAMIEDAEAMAILAAPCLEEGLTAAKMGAVKAINASRMAFRGDGKHKVSLDKVIRTMRDTGRDMRDKYKETSRGGLAVNVIEC